MAVSKLGLHVIRRLANQLGKHQMNVCLHDLCLHDAHSMFVPGEIICIHSSFVCSCGFVEYRNMDEAKAVFEKQEDIILDGHTLFIDYSKVTQLIDLRELNV